MSIPSSTSASTPAEPAKVTGAEIDASCRWPLLSLFATAALWLAGSALFSLLVAIKLHKADILADCPWLTLGRLRPAVNNAFLYGFATPVAMGITLWLLCRLGRVKLAFQWPMLIVCKLWNIGVFVGIWAILAGGSTGFEWLEMPRYASGILFVAFVLFGLCAVGTFSMRRAGELYPSQWFLLGAIFWMAWSYSAANYLLVFEPVRGTFQSVINAWFTGNLINLWLAPVALAAIYYFLPLQIGQPLYSRELAAFAFWTTLFLGSFAGLSSLVGAPVPRWIGSAGTAGYLCLLAPLIANAMNWHLTSKGNCSAWKHDLVLRFLATGAVAYLALGLLNLVLSVSRVSAVTSLTYAVVAKNYLAWYGFVAMVLLGCVYAIVPRLTQVAWPSEKLIRVHFTCSALGAALIVLALLAGGVIQGFNLANPSVAFLDVVRKTIPFIGISTLGILLFLIGQVVFLLHLGQVLRACLQPFAQAICAECCGAPLKAGGKS